MHCGAVYRQRPPRSWAAPSSSVDAVRFEKGEGIEKKQENFAEEIAKLAK